MKIYAAGLSTETNSFAATPTGRIAFEAGGMRLGDGSGHAPVFDPLEAIMRRLAADGGHELVLGLLAFAMPSGPTVRAVYEWLREELLDGLRRAMPVDAVVLPLHGAMIAEGYDDCEGDIIERVRDIVGPDFPIGVELDLHCHFTERMRSQADVIVAYKEYPHTDLTERLEEMWNLTIATSQGRIRPVTAVFDCRMTDLWHTTREPMRSLVRRMQALEGQDGILSVSFGHGFPWGDVPDAGPRSGSSRTAMSRRPSRPPTCWAEKSSRCAPRPVSSTRR